MEEEDGTWCTDVQRIREIVVGYFQVLFTTDQPANVFEIMSCVPCKVGYVENRVLTERVTDVERGESY